MADLKISELAPANVVQKNDLFYLIQDGDSKNLTASTLFSSIADPTLAGNIIIGGNVQTLSGAGTVSITTTRTDLYGGVSANASAILNGSVLPATIFLYTTNVAATGRGVSFETGAPFTKTIYVTYKNSKINLSGTAGTLSYPPEDWVGPTGLRPFSSGLYFVKGSKYIFDVSDSTNSSNVFGLSTSIDGTNSLGIPYTANVVVNGTPGSAGANIEFTVANVSIDPGGTYLLDLPIGEDGQLKVINLVRTSGGKFVLSGNLQNNISAGLTRSGDSAFLMYSGNGWIFVGASPGLQTSFSGTSDDVPEGSKLYFTNARARAAIQAGDSSITYDKNTGNITANVSGALSSSLVGTDISLGNLIVTGKITTANISTGNITANFYSGNGVFLTGIVPSLTGVTTANLSESSSNLYYTNARVYAAISGNLALKANVVDLTTANVIESASNLYYTNARVYSAISGNLALKANVVDLTTANVLESSSNLYYTNARVYAAISGNLALKANVVDLTTANVSEVTNQYFTNVRSVSAVVNSTLSNITVSGNIIAGNISVTKITSNIWAGIYTANVIESSSNLYYTNARVYSAIAGNLALKANVVDLTTANVIESASNLYYTNARVYSAIAGNLALKANVVDLTTANVLESSSNLYYTNARVYAAISGNLALKANVVDLTTANVIESASNLYYTDARSRAAISSGTGVSYDASTGAISIGQNVNTSANVTFAQLNITGQVNFYGNVTTHTSNNLSISDNMIYLNSASESSNPDLGFAGNYNDGIYRHAGFFRDASDGIWKVFDNYIPEPDASQFIDTSHITYKLANLSATTFIGNVFGTVSNISNFTTSNLSEGVNLYYTNTRVQSYLGNISGNILPSIANYYDLGSETKPFRDLWLGGSSIKFSNSGSISSTGNTFVIADSSGNVILSANTTNKPITSPTGTITAELIASVPGLSTSNIAEGANLYFNNVRAQTALQTTVAELRLAILAPASNVIYVAGNGNDSNSGNTPGNALANIHIALARATQWTTVFVKSGDYTLYNQPVTIGRRVGLVGDNLRTTTIRPSQPSVDMFYVNNACYVTGFTFRGHVSPSAVFSFNPNGSAGTIVTSPYIQNSSSITTTGTGMRVDGSYVSGLRSMVCDAYTQTNEGGIGIHMLNRGYTQLVSVFTICCHIAIKCETGGFCSITNSNASFGTYGLWADGVSDPLYYGKLQGDTLGEQFVITNLSQRPNYGDSVLFANYNQDKCFRDIGLVVDALALDLAYSGNTQSNFAGLQYWGQTESAIPNQAIETLAAISYAKGLAANVIANIRINSTYQVANLQQFATSPTLIADIASNIKVAAEFDLIANIIQNGTVGVTDLIVTNSYPANTNAFVNHASNLLYLNNTFIASEVVSFVNNTYPLFTYNTNTCFRDVGFILDSIRFDLLHGGNRQAITAGTYYYNYNADTTQINNQIVQTAAAYNFIGTIIANVITATTVSPYNVAKCSRDTGLIIDSLVFDLAYSGNTQSNFAGLQYWAQSNTAIPNQATETLAAINYAKNLATNVAANTAVILTRSAVPQVRGEAGSLSANIIINSEFDLIANIISGGTGGVTDRIIPNTYPANTNAQLNNASNLLYLNNTFIAAEVVAFVNNTYPSFTYDTNTCARDVGFILESVRFDLVHGGNRQAIMAGTYYYNFSSNTTQINNQIVQTSAAYNFIGTIIANVITASTVSPYNVAKCSRDTGLIIDSLAIDLAFGSNTQSTFAGLQYWAQSNTAIPNQATETIAAINYAKNLATNVIANIRITSTYQFANVQQFATSPTLIADITSNIKVAAEFDLIANIISGGTGGVSDRIISNGYPANTNAFVNHAANLLVQNNTFIKSEVLAFVNTTYPTFSYNSNTCARDVGFIIDSVTFDLLQGGNRQAIMAGTYYYNYSSNVTTINNEIPQTNAAYIFIGSILDEIVTGTVITSLYQTVIAQNTTAAPASTTATSNIVLNNIGLITNIIANGPNVAPAKRPIVNTPSTDANVINATKLIIANKEFITAEVLAYIDDALFDPPYQTVIKQNTTAAPASTYATATTILQNIGLISNIIVNGPSSAAAKRPISNTPSTDANVINAAKLIVANKEFIKAEVIAYIDAVLFDPPYQAAVKQNTTAAPASTYATATTILQNIGLISNIITIGPTVALTKRPIGLTASTDANVINATKLIIANKDFIKAEVLEFTNKNWANISNGSGTFYTVKAATPLSQNTSTVTLLETVLDTIRGNSSVSFHAGSYISSSGHTFEYVGSGDTIATALPYLGGVPVQENEVIELRGGKVYFTSTDQLGDFRIGKGLVINRVDGTISGRTFTKALFAVMTPYILAIEG